MNYQEFINTYNGQAIDYDGGYGVQCVDLIKLYLDVCFGIKIGAIGNAEAYWRRYEEVPALRNNFNRIENNPDFIPQTGDIVIWGTGLSKYGHVAIATGEGTTSWFASYDQNWNGKPMHWVKHTYKLDFKGVLRPKMSYQAHVQDIGWQDVVGEGQEAGTTGQSKRVEAIKIFSPGIAYRAYLQDTGWTDWVSNGQECGTTGESRRLEAIEIKSPLPLLVHAHLQDTGWQNQEQNIGYYTGMGTVGEARRLEAFTIKLIDNL